MRAIFKEKRRALSLEDVVSRSAAIVNRLCAASLIQGKHIALYLSRDQEVMAEQLVPWVIKHQMDCYLPVLNPGSRILSFAQYEPEVALEPNRYGILEPTLPRLLCEPTQLDTVIVPLVAFTARCERLGTGAGYYDATFAFLNNPSRPVRPVLIGLAYDFQQVPTLIQHERDVLLDYIVTESQVITRSVR